VRYASFVVRLWQPETADAPDGGLHGRIEHVQSGIGARVTCLDDVTAFIRERLLATARDEPEDEGSHGVQTK